jgi:hypothetical protein
MPTLSEAEDRLAKLPTLRAYVIGTVMGIALSLIAQLILKPISIGSDFYGNFTIMSGNRIVGVIPPATYYLEVGFALVGGILLWWFLQKWFVVGVRGDTLDKITHGVSETGLSSFVTKLSVNLDKLKLQGYETHPHPGERGTFHFNIQSTYEDDDVNVHLTIEPYVALIEAKASDRESLGLAKLVIATLNETSKGN